MAENRWKLMEIYGNIRKCLEWLEIAGNFCKWIELLKMAENG